MASAAYSMLYAGLLGADVSRKMKGGEGKEIEPPMEFKSKFNKERLRARFADKPGLVGKYIARILCAQDFQVIILQPLWDGVTRSFFVGYPCSYRC